MTVHVNDNPQVIAKGSCTTCIFSGAAASALDATEAGIWEEVLAAHIDLVQAARTPSGFTSSKYGRLPYAFPAALRFQGEDSRDGGIAVTEMIRQLRQELGKAVPCVPCRDAGMTKECCPTTRFGTCDHCDHFDHFDISAWTYRPSQANDNEEEDETKNET
ncbi:hypothetical protein PENARI_c007G06105 [Penicillium arizonense]|uniref:Uncharacterized protein n=1 Tax=Penicillium arizonense TaxID=1835702 RepID=A0A1F5LL46_PENAI|nr:hypothetical protein PENARI_c007G06105 [Penicillium arizonense]OGE53826.1 hypothetical protein PENARI_c007G06105 [Penicillium arizonense]